MFKMEFELPHEEHAALFSKVMRLLQNPNYISEYREPYYSYLDMHALYLFVGTTMILHWPSDYRSSRSIAFNNLFSNIIHDLQFPIERPVSNWDSVMDSYHLTVIKIIKGKISEMSPFDDKAETFEIEDTTFANYDLSNDFSYGADEYLNLPDVPFLRFWYAMRFAHSEDFHSCKDFCKNDSAIKRLISDYISILSMLKKHRLFWMDFLFHNEARNEFMFDADLITDEHFYGFRKYMNKIREKLSYIDYLRSTCLVGLSSLFYYTNRKRSRLLLQLSSDKLDRYDSYSVSRLVEMIVDEGSTLEEWDTVQHYLGILPIKKYCVYHVLAYCAKYEDATSSEHKNLFLSICSTASIDLTSSPKFWMDIPGNLIIQQYMMVVLVINKLEFGHHTYTLFHKLCETYYLAYGTPEETLFPDYMCDDVGVLFLQIAKLLKEHSTDDQVNYELIHFYLKSAIHHKNLEAHSIAAALLMETDRKDVVTTSMIEFYLYQASKVGDVQSMRLLLNKHIDGFHSIKPEDFFEFSQELCQRDIAIDRFFYISTAYLKGIGVEKSPYLYRSYVTQGLALGCPRTAALTRSVEARLFEPVYFTPKLRKTWHKTIDGRRVQSKSELVIATALYYHGLSEYEYSKPMNIGSVRVKPDFVFKTADNKEILWEHLGLLKEGDYRENWVKKHDAYLRVGFRDNQTLFVTSEDDNGFLSMDDVEVTIDLIKKQLAKIGDSIVFE